MGTEIEQLLNQIEDAYHHRAAKACAALYHPNARHPLPTDEVAVGHAEIRKHLPLIFEMVPEISRPKRSPGRLTWSHPM